MKQKIPPGDNDWLAMIFKKTVAISPGSGSELQGLLMSTCSGAIVIFTALNTDFSVSAVGESLRHGIKEENSVMMPNR